MIKSYRILRPIGIICFIFLLSVIFIEPLRTKMNNIFMPKNREELKEEEVVGTVAGYNPRVKEMQEILKDAGFYAGRVDGFMGANTRRAILNFQNEKGLRPTGRLNQLTISALNRESQLPASNREEKQEVAAPQQSQPQQKPQVKKRPAMGIEEIQAALAEAGFYAGKIDGIMGPKTKKALRAFQSSQGLKADAIAGPRTQKALSEYLDKQGR